MAGYKIALSAGLALLLLAACERPSAVQKKTEDTVGSASTPEYGREDRSSPRDNEDVTVREIDGKPIWSASRRGSAEENAQRSFERNGSDFGAKSLDDFVRKAHAFVENPPSGVQRASRSNGDTMLYDPKANVFAVVNRDGAPRTMFKPDEGQAYWDQQKSQAERRASNGGGSDRGSGQ